MRSKTATVIIVPATLVIFYLLLLHHVFVVLIIATVATIAVFDFIFDILITSADETHRGFAFLLSSNICLSGSTTTKFFRELTVYFV